MTGEPLATLRPRIEPQTSRTISDVFNHYVNLLISVFIFLQYDIIYFISITHTVKYLLSLEAFADLISIFKPKKIL